MNNTLTREDWLARMVAALRPVYAERGAILPPLVRVSIGFPSRNALSIKRRRVGECWHAEASGDGAREIFVSPLQDQQESVSTLAHELVHACLPPTAKHGAAFKRLGSAVGLEGKPAHMIAGPALALELAAIGASIGPWPAARLNALSLPKPQGTRLLKVECPEGSGYTVRITRKWLDELGAPICPCCTTAMIEG